MHANEPKTDAVHLNVTAAVTQRKAKLMQTVADPGFANGWAKVERRRRKYQGAEGAEGNRVWGGGFPLPTGGRVWEGGSAPSPENFFDFRSKMSTSSAF